MGSMNDKNELGDIPPLVPEREDVASHLSDKRAQSQEIVSPAIIQRESRLALGLSG